MGRHRGGCRAQRAHRRGDARQGGPVHAGARAPRAGRRVLRHRGDRARLPRVDHLLHRVDAAARGDPRAAPRAARAADDPVRARAPGGPGRRRGAGRLGRHRANRRRDQEVLGRRRACVRGRRRRAEGARGSAAAAVHAVAAGHQGDRAARVSRTAAAGSEPARGPRHRTRRANPAADRQPGPVRRCQVRVAAGEGPGAGQQPVRQARRALPAWHAARPGLSPAHWRGAGGAGVLRPRDGRHGRDQ